MKASLSHYPRKKNPLRKSYKVLVCTLSVVADYCVLSFIFMILTLLQSASRCFTSSVGVELPLLALQCFIHNVIIVSKACSTVLYSAAVNTVHFPCCGTN